MEKSTDLSSDALPDRRVARKAVQTVAWLIWIAHFAFIARQKIFVRGRLDFDTVDTYAAVDVSVVFFLALVLLFSRKISQFLSIAFKSSLFWLLAYYMVCALSAVWSLRPLYSLYRSVECVIFISSLFVALSYCTSFEKAERKVLFLSLLSVFVQMGIHMKSGPIFSLGTWHTNAYSASAAVLFAYCAGEYLALGKKKLLETGERLRRKMLFRYGLLSFLLLALGTSSASNVAALFGIIVILFAQRRIGLVMFIMYASILFFFLGGGMEPLKDVLFPGKTDQGIETLGGRTIAWTYYAERIANSPIWGYGLGVVPSGKGAVFEAYSKGGVGAAYSHNFVLSILIGTGFLGLFVFIFFPLKLARELKRSLRRKIMGATGVLGAMAAGFVNSLAMPMIADRWVTASFAFFSILALFILHVYPHSSRSSKPSLPEFSKQT